MSNNGSSDSDVSTTTTMMFCWYVFGVLCLCVFPSQTKLTIPIGYVPDNMSSNNAPVYSGAILLAVDRINKDPGLLPNITLQLRYRGRRGGSAEGLTGVKAVSSLICEDTYAFFGPGTPCLTEARLAASYDLPMISYVSRNT